ncbi:MAG: DUF3955 domain-containing protein [Halodesulfovibrio sp.]|uniref:DUF3955 domain-containing protein n=1 Tax=Halodesulfovibrio sp. TaxID=1912772 RepID=UPI00359E28E5
MCIFKNKIAWLFLIASLVCGISYNVIGSHIDENGFLIEPFFLIPLTWLFFFISMLSFIIGFTRTVSFHKKRTSLKDS